MSKQMGIYKIMNLATGKFYLGSSNDLEKRKREHFWAMKNNKHPNPYLQNAFNKYGESNFAFVVVEIVSDKEMLFPTEQWYINSLQACNRSVGYNINEYASGGGLLGDANPNFGKPMSEEQKEKIRKTMIGQRYSAERCANMSRNRIGKGTGAANYNYGRIVTDAERKAQSEKMKGRYAGDKNPAAVAVINVDTGQIFSTAKSAAEICGAHRANICACCRGRVKRAGGYRWQYYHERHREEYREEYLNII